MLPRYLTILVLLPLVAVLGCSSPAATPAAAAKTADVDAVAKADTADDVAADSSDAKDAAAEVANDAGADASPPSDVTVVVVEPAVQSPATFAASFKARGVVEQPITETQVSCYAPEAIYLPAVSSQETELDLGPSLCNGAATTGENVGPYATQEVALPPLRVKDHGESDLQVDPSDPKHLLGESKWFVDNVRYVFITGFFESFDGGKTWPVQGHNVGFEGWETVTDPIGAFDPWGNFYALQLGYMCYFDETGGTVCDDPQMPNPGRPRGFVGLSVRPKAGVPGKNPADAWLASADLPDYVTKTDDPYAVFDKQWIAIDTGANSPHKGRIYVVWLEYHPVSAEVQSLVAWADGKPDGSHGPWSKPQRIPPDAQDYGDSYPQVRVSPDGSVWSQIDRNLVDAPLQHDVGVVVSHDGGASWSARKPALSFTSLETFANTSNRPSIPVVFAVGQQLVAGHYPLYLAWEADEGGSSALFVAASFDDGTTWSAGQRVADGGKGSDAIQANLAPLPDGRLAVVFYDRRLACPGKDSPAAEQAGLALDPALPYLASNWCLMPAVQMFSATLQRQGGNVALSTAPFDPQLSAPTPSGDGTGATFVGDYSGAAGDGTDLLVAFVSTLNYGKNPHFHQQQVFARLPLAKVP